MKKAIISIFLLMFVVSLSGCIEIVDSYTDYVIYEFDEIMREIHDDKEEARYIQSGKLDFAKTNGTIIVPHIKDHAEDTCIFLVYAYFVGEPEDVKIENASISKEDGSVIWSLDVSKTDIQRRDLEEILDEDVMDGYVFVIDTFEKSSDWFWDGNKLDLILTYTVGEGTKETEVCVNYEVVIERHKHILMPT